MTQRPSRAAIDAAPRRPNKKAREAALRVLRDQVRQDRHYAAEHAASASNSRYSEHWMQSSKRLTNRADRLAEVIAWMEGQDG